MPWICPTCSKEKTGAQPPFPAPQCNRPPTCKKVVCRWVGEVRQPPAAAGPVPAAADTATLAANLGYGTRINSHNATFVGGHSTGVLYVNEDETRAISPDGSTHSGDRSGWKGFEFKSGGWRYAGSFDMDLNQWPHRPNNRFAVFPRGE